MAFIAGSLPAFLAGAQPKVQTALPAIQILCDRLQHSVLLEDRRAAVLGLKGFARDYKESVASAASRSLIHTLKRDSADNEIISAALETLLVLLVKGETTDGIDDISLWIADAFTHTDEDMASLLQLLNSSSFYIRLYTLQILSIICEHRLQRAQACVFASPFGIPYLVLTLDDNRDAIRNEGLLLLIRLSHDNSDIQKLIAFENAFEKLFRIMNEEVSGIVVTDCLHLFVNLLQHNPSNQNFFQETGGIANMKSLLLVEDWSSSIVENTSMLLHIIGLFVARDSHSSYANQSALESAGILVLVSNIAFNSGVPNRIRAEALSVVGCLIFENLENQEAFILENPGRIKDLLEMVINTSSVSLFGLRLAAVSCLDGYLSANQAKSQAFLSDTIKGFFDKESSPNILDLVINLSTDVKADPYRTWFACIILVHLIFEDQDCKFALQKIKLGDEQQGEDAITFIQSISANLIIALTKPLDHRISIGYLMLLIVLLHNDLTSVDDFLGEASTIQALVAFVASGKNVILIGLCTLLLGIICDISTSSSPVARTTIFSIVRSRIGRDLFIGCIHRLRESASLREFSPFEWKRDEPGLPDVIFDLYFVDFVKDNYPKIQRSIDQDPLGKGEKSADEIIDSLKTEVDEKCKIIEQMELDKLAEQDSHSAAINGCKIEFSELDRKHKSEVSSLQQEIQSLRSLKAENDQLSKEIKQTKETAGTLFSNVRNELSSLKKTKESLEAENKGLSSKAESQKGLIETLEREKKALHEKHSKIKNQHDKVKSQLSIELKDKKELEHDLERERTANKDLQSKLDSERESLSKLRQEENLQKDMQLAHEHLKEQHAITLRKLDDADKLVDHLRNQIRDMENSLQAKTDEYEKIIGSLRLENVELVDLQKLNQKLQQDMDDLKLKSTLHEQQLREFEQTKEQCNSLRMKYEDSISHVKELENQVKASSFAQDTYNELHEIHKSQSKDLEEAKNASEHAKRELNEANEKMKNSIGSHKQELAALQTKYDEIKKEHEEQKPLVELLKQKNLDLFTIEQVFKDKSELELELLNEKNQLKKCQTDFDDMLLLMGDLSEKRDRDKLQMRAAGLAVSDAEEIEETLEY